MPSRASKAPARAFLPWPSAPTGAGWPRAASTKRSSCGGGRSSKGSDPRPATRDPCARATGTVQRRKAKDETRNPSASSLRRGCPRQASLGWAPLGFAPFDFAQGLRCAPTGSARCSDGVSALRQAQDLRYASAALRQGLRWASTGSSRCCDGSFAVLRRGLSLRQGRPFGKLRTFAALRRGEDADWLPQVEGVRPLALIELEGPEGGVPEWW